MAKEHPEESDEIQKKLEELEKVWEALRDLLKKREESLGEAGDLQKFLKDLDRFQSWLSETQTIIASDDTPQSVNEADKLLQQHQAIKLEIDNYQVGLFTMTGYNKYHSKTLFSTFCITLLDVR